MKLLVSKLKKYFLYTVHPKSLYTSAKVKDSVISNSGRNGKNNWKDSLTKLRNALTGNIILMIKIFDKTK